MQVEFFRDKQWDIIGRSKLWFLFSGVTIVLGLVFWGVRGLNYGIDFTGGSLLRYEFATPLAESEAQVPGVMDKVRGVLGRLGLSNSQIQVVSDEQGRLSQLYLRTPPVANDEEAQQRDAKVVAELKQAFADKGEITDLGRESVGPVVGAELRNKAILALVIGSLLIGVYISVRYEFRYAVAGILALLHDALVATGAVAIFHVELNSSFVAAILTILGYSINDSVVIFDRIRENMKLHRGRNFADTVNLSLLQTFARSINTVLTVLICTLALLILGGEALRGFGLALLFGITTGAYSSIFFAPPLLVLWERRSPQGVGARTALPRAAATTGGRARQEPEAAQTAAGGATVPTAASPAARLRPTPAAQTAADTEEEREARRERRQREKERQAKKGGKGKRRF